MHDNSAASSLQFLGKILLQTVANSSVSRDEKSDDQSSVERIAKKKKEKKIEREKRGKVGDTEVE